MALGFIQYNRVQKGWSKVKLLFLVQLATVLFFCIHEFTNKTIRGYFLIFVMTSYGMFLTFGVVFDGMQDEETKARRDRMHGLDFIFRVSMHAATAVLFLSVFFVDLTCTV